MAGGRPNLVRADTLDLQDQEAPTAAEHHKHIDHEGIAPHQATQFQHVEEERRSEEETLADAWNMAGQHSEEQGANGQADSEPQKKPEGKGAANGEAEEDSDGEEDDEDDDDMMDRMSSSPSIGDGASTNNFFTAAIATPGTPQHVNPTRATFNQSPTTAASSSPFIETPEHMPLRLDISSSQSASVLDSAADEILSPSIRTPETSPLITNVTFGRVLSISSERHRLGRYQSGLEPGLEPGLDDEGFCEGDDQISSGVSTHLEQNGQSEIACSQASLTGTRGNAFAQQQAEGLAFMNPLNENGTDVEQISNSPEDSLTQPPPSPTHSDNSWESDSSEDLTAQDINDDDADAFLNLDDRFIDSGWGGECLRETEDIDFEFVYALHTFVATVEGQANATKGDTMVLLDDSNSYWWLVRVVKDSSIGYLPAEHIETPTERLARLNKHRNIDLSQTMLGDNPEKSRNPLKKAMRRRTTKTVQFAAPTYVEASDYDYSTEDEDGMLDQYTSAAEPQEQEQVSDRGPPAEVEERNAPEEANVHATRRFSGESIGGGNKSSFDSASAKASMDSKRSSIDDPQLSPKLVDRSEAAPLKSRKGTPRNADSFLKDESIETRKISLTPGLLRDDSQSKASSTESTRNASFESLVKTPSPQEERSKRDSKDKKKDKKGDKKQGMLSGLFKSKKKDKKGANLSRDEGELSDMEKVSAEMTRGPSQAQSGAVSPVERMTPGPSQARAKLQKAPPAAESVRIMSPIQDEPQQAPQAQQQQYPHNNGFVAELEGSQAVYEMATGDEDNLPPNKIEKEIPPPAPAPEKSSPLSPIAAMLRSNSSSDPKPKKAKRSKQRVELDDFDEPEEEDNGPNPFDEQAERSRKQSQDSDRLSASPVEILSPGSGTFMHGTEIVHIPQLNADDDDEDEGSDEPENINPGDSHSTSTAPSFIEKPTEQNTEEAQSKDKALPTKEEDTDLTPKAQTPQPATSESRDPTPARSDDHSTDSLPSTDDDGRSSTATAETPISSSPQQPSSQQQFEWDDVNLRAWFDADEVKDMLAIIHHSKHDVAADNAPAVEHPSMQGLFANERKGVDSMMGELDGLLGGLLQRKGVVFT
ncbi:hypothetical protein Q7P37_001738 [Cladosporium fusiforme]